MEVYVVSFGDSYERDVIGVTHSLDGCRVMARNYLERVHYMARRGAPYVPSVYEYFSYVSYVPGVAIGHNDVVEHRFVMEGFSG